MTMAELLLEVFSEEIPARMQARAAEDLRRLVTEGLKAHGLAAGEAKAFATPRRLALVVEGVSAKSPDFSEERKGPRVNASEQAIAGFLKSAGLKSIKEAEIVKDEKKGDFYVAKITDGLEERPSPSLPRSFCCRYSNGSRGPNPCAGARGACLGFDRCTRRSACLDGRPLERNLIRGRRTVLIPRARDARPRNSVPHPGGQRHARTSFSRQ